MFYYRRSICGVEFKINSQKGCYRTQNIRNVPIGRLSFGSRSDTAYPRAYSELRSAYLNISRVHLSNPGS